MQQINWITKNHQLPTHGRNFQIPVSLVQIRFKNREIVAEFATIDIDLISKTPKTQICGRPKVQLERKAKYTMNRIMIQ